MPKLTQDKIAEIIEKAFESGDLSAGGLLLPDQAARFVRGIIDATVITKECRREPMRANTKVIDKIGFADRIMVAAVESTPPADEDIKKPTPGKVTLTAVEALAAVNISYDALEDNIEGGQMQQTLLDLIAERCGLDLEGLYLYGDTEQDDDSFLALLDGWLKLAGEEIDAEGAPVSKKLFHKALQALPDKYLTNEAEWRFYVSPSVNRDYRYTLSERATAAGDRYLLENVPVYYNGVPVVKVGAIKTENIGNGTPAVGGSQILLVNPRNLIVGLHRNIMTELERKPRARTIETTTTLRTDCEIEEPLAVVKITNVAHLTLEDEEE